MSVAQKKDQDQPLLSTRDGMGRALLAIGKLYPSVVVLTADLSESTKVDAFAKKFPQRFIQIGVAEQNMAGVAAGLALGKKVPLIASYAVFNPGINWAVLRTAIAYSNLHVIIVGGHAGLATGQDGATHQALEDLALMRSLPNLTVLAPADEEEAYQMTLAAIKLTGPVYLRTSKLPVPSVTPITSTFSVGRAPVLKPGSDVTIIAHGTMVSRALEAATLAKKEAISVRVINASSIKPLDEATILKSFRETQSVISIEDHQQIGGLGSAIAELVSQTTIRVPFKIMGVADSFGESGSANELYEKHRLTPQAILAEIHKQFSAS